MIKSHECKSDFHKIADSIFMNPQKKETLISANADKTFIQLVNFLMQDEAFMTMKVPEKVKYDVG